MGLTGCDLGHASLVTGCAEEDKEVDELGEEEDEEPSELYSGDVSSAVKRRRRPAHLFVFLGAPSHKGRVPRVTPSRAHSIQSIQLSSLENITEYVP